jgi:hypothetical protein
MTWNPPLRHRTLDELERTMICSAISRMVRSTIVEAIEDSLELGVRVFARLTAASS